MNNLMFLYRKKVALIFKLLKDRGYITGNQQEDILYNLGKWKKIGIMKKKQFLGLDYTERMKGIITFLINFLDKHQIHYFNNKKLTNDYFILIKFVIAFEDLFQ